MRWNLLNCWWRKDHTESMQCIIHTKMYIWNDVFYFAFGILYKWINLSSNDRMIKHKKKDYQQLDKGISTTEMRHMRRMQNICKISEILDR